MLLADLGAEVLRIDRKGGNGWPNPVVDRGRSMVAADIRSDEGRRFCVFANPSAQQWCEILEGTDACFSPVVELADVADFLHMAARGALFGPTMRCSPRPRRAFRARLAASGQVRLMDMN